MDKQYKNIQDVLPVGTHRAKVFPRQEWDTTTNGPIEGTVKHGTGKKGNEWWLYQTKVGEEYISLFADAKNKAFFETGEIDIVIKPLINRHSKKPEVDEAGNPVLRAYYNQVPLTPQQAAEAVGGKLVEDVTVDEVPF